MYKININELSALLLVLANMTITELLYNAMLGLSQEETIQAQSKANICSQAINTYLN